MDESYKMNVSENARIWSKDFIIICLANFFIFLGFQMTLPTLPLFVKELDGSDQMIGFIVGIFTFSALLLRPMAGHMLETKGRKFVYLLGLSIFVISVGSYAFIASIWLLIIMRVVQGVGWGYSTTATGTIATDLIPPKRRGEGLGYFGLSGNIALAFGPSLGLALYGKISFTWLFIIAASLGLVAFILSNFITYKPVKQTDDKREATKRKWDIFEKSAIKPSVLLFFITLTFGGIATFLPVYTEQENIGGIEIYFLLYALFLLISRSFSGRLYDRYGHIVVFLPGTLMIFIAMLLLMWLPNAMALFVAASLYGLGFGSIQPALQAWAVNNAAKERKGMATATYYSFFDLGIGIGALVFGQIASLSGYSEIYLTSAVSVSIAMLLYIFLLFFDRRKNK